MASIVNKNNKFYVIYTVTNEHDEKKQKWETYYTEAEAKKRKKEIEFQQGIGDVTLPHCSTLKELLDEYVSLYGKTKWSLSAYTSNKALINNYILPFIGKMKLHEINAHIIERYYQKLLKTPSVARVTDSCFHPVQRMVGTSTIRDVHKLLRSAFNQAMKWDLMEKNPATLAEVPKHEAKKRTIWDLDVLAHVNEVCPDERLKLCINMSFACSLRLGELLGLTWNCVDVSEDSIKNGTAYIYVNKELQRVAKDALKELNQKDVLVTFPEATTNSKSVLVLKSPKTPSSIRKIYLPYTVAEMLLQWKKEQDDTKEALGNDYYNFDLVIASPIGTPVEGGRIQSSFKRLIARYDLPPVVFHSLRHSSITYKLKFSGGDIKAVQGDSGHAQAKMVTDQYSHILDESRKGNALLLEKEFYQRKECDESSDTNQLQNAEVNNEQKDEQEVEFQNKIRRLRFMREQGVITEEEFQNKINEIIRSI